MPFQKGNRLNPEKIRAIATAILVFSLPTLVPGLGWLRSIMPLPVYYVLNVHGRRQGTEIVLWALAGTGTAALLAGAFPGFFFSLSLIPVGYILAGTGEKQSPLLTRASKATVYLALVWLLLAFLFGAVNKINPHQEIVQSIEQGVAETIALYKESGQFDAEAMETISAFMERLQGHMVRLFPALLLTSILCTVWLTLLLGQWLFKKRATGHNAGEDLQAWRLPDLLVWPVILAGFALLAPNARLNDFGLNLGFVLLIAYLTQGLAIVATLMRRWALPKLFRVALYVFLFLEVYGLVIVAALGLADVWLDLRNRKAREEAG